MLIETHVIMRLAPALRGGDVIDRHMQTVVGIEHRLRHDGDFDRRRRLLQVEAQTDPRIIRDRSSF